MKIVNKANKGVSFSSLKPGDVFLVSERLFMKIKVSKDLNAVALDEGTMKTFGEDDGVTPKPDASISLD